MQSKPHRALRNRLALISIAPAALLSACGPPINIYQPALPCDQMVEASGLLNPTPGASLPQDDSKAQWIGFGDAQTGQIDKANNDKAGTRALLKLCREWQDKAAAAAKPKPFWRRIFS